jgi:DNA-binding XRE family transcriptional regulator
MLSHWPTRLPEFLGVFQQVAKHRTTSTGISRRFGLLLREAAHLEEIGYAAPADALRDYLVRHYATGHLSGKVCLFQGRANRSSLARRPWITQTEAARLLRIRSGAISSLVARGILVGQIHPAGEHGRSVGLILRQSVESLQSDLHSAVDVCATARRLGIGRHAVLNLIHENLLPRAVRTAKGWQVPSRSVRDLEALGARLPQIKGETAGWISLRQATRVAGSSGLALSQILKLIQAGFLQARMAEPPKGLNGIVVAQADLAAAQKEVRDHGDLSSDWALHHAARSLFPGRPVKACVLKRWIQARLLRACKQGRRTMIFAEEIKRFRAEYCLAQEATQVLGISRATLSRWEVQGRVVPVYGRRVTPQAGFSLYRRQDLRRLVEATL